MNTFIVAQAQVWLPDASDLVFHVVALFALGVSAFAATAWLTRMQSKLKGHSVVLDRLIPWLPLIQLGIWLLAALLTVLILGQANDTTVAWILVPGIIAGVFASRDIVRNALAGVLVALEHSILTGDIIHVATPEGDVHGQIVSIGLRRTTLRTDDGSEVHLPNHTLLSSTVRTNRGHELDSAVEVEFDLPTATSPHENDMWKRHARRAATFSRFASPKKKPEVFVQPRQGGVKLVVQAYAFSPRHTRHLQSDIVEIFEAARRKNAPQQLPDET